MSWATSAHRMLGLTSGVIRRAAGNNHSVYRATLGLGGVGNGHQRIPGYLGVFSKSLHSRSLFPEAVVSDPETTAHPVSIVQQSSGSGGAGDLEGDSAALTDLVAASFNNLPSGAMGPIGSIFSNAPPVLVAQDLFTQLHDIPGMDWTKSIILATFGIRLLVGLPLAVFQQQSMAKLENLQPQFKQLATELSRETSIAVKIYNWNERRAKSAFKASFKRHWRKIVEDNNCHPMRALLLVWLQVPFWVCFSSALRNVVYAIPEPRTSEMLQHWMQMAMENPLWIESLASVDPYILPLIFLTANLTNIQINSMRKLHVPQTTLQKVVPWVFRVGVVGISVLAAFTPSAVTIYWATSSVCALLQNVLMKAPPVRRFFRIPSTPSTP